MPILGIIASSRLTGPTPIEAFFQIGTIVGPSGSSITFSNIPSTYDHLEIHQYGKDNRSPVYSAWTMRFNGDTGNNYNYATVQIDDRTSGPFVGNAVASSTILGGGMPGSSGTQYRGASIARIFDYTNTNKFTTVMSRGGYSGYTDGSPGNGLVYLSEGVWVNTSVINSITMQFDGTALVAGTRFSLYGIKGS